MQEVRIRFSEPLLRDAVGFFFLRSVIRRLGFGFFAAFGLLTLLLGWLLYEGQPGWIVGFLAAFLLFSIAFVAMVYVLHYRNTIGRFRRMNSPEAILRLDEDRIGFSSEFGESNLPWSSILEIWRHERFWLLLFSPSQFVTLPLDSLDESTRAFITRKVEERAETENPPP